MYALATGIGLVREADGSAAERPHPATGHPHRVYVDDVNVTLDGDPVPKNGFLLADEESGLVLSLDTSELLKRRLIAAQGTVRIEWNPLPHCRCAECKGQVYASRA